MRYQGVISFKPLLITGDSWSLEDKTQTQWAGRWGDKMGCHVSAHFHEPGLGMGSFLGVAEQRIGGVMVADSVSNKMLWNFIF